MSGGRVVVRESLVVRGGGGGGAACKTIKEELKGNMCVNVTTCDNELYWVLCCWKNVRWLICLSVSGF